MDAKTDKREPTAEADCIAHAVVGAALEVHKQLGPGFLESVYEEAMCIELELSGVEYARQQPAEVSYKGRTIAGNRVDLLVGGLVVVELKAVDRLAPLHTAQLISYLKATGCRLGLLINFNVPRLKDGIKRVVLST